MQKSYSMKHFSQPIFHMFIILITHYTNKDILIKNYTKIEEMGNEIDEKAKTEENKNLL